MPDAILTHREEQRRLYGEPLADIVTRVMRALGLTQSRLADVLGLSAPMLSQLMSARRVKIGNPQVVERLRALVELAGRAGSVDDLPAELDRIKGAESTITTTRVPGTADDVVMILAATGTPDGLRRAAGAVEDEPALAMLLRRAAEAEL